MGVTGYEVERCQGAGCSSFGLVTTVATLSWSDTGRSPGTSYSYRVRARDAAGNRGAYSSVVSVVTPAAVDAPPSAPSSLVASASGSTGVGLSWSAATDDLGVSGYEVERCQGSGCSGFVQVGTTASTSFADSGLVASTSYSYRVRARDTGNQVGPYSNVASATTGTAPPPPSSSLVAAYSFDEGSGGTVGDASGNGNAGQVGNATWTTSGKYGKALSFGGSAKVQVPDSPSLDLTTGATVEAWVYPQAAQNGWRAIVQKQVDSYLLHAEQRRRPADPRRRRHRLRVNTCSRFALSALPIGAWTHLAMTYDGSRVRLYVNGVQESSVPGDGADPADGKPALDRRNRAVRRGLQRPRRRGADLPGQCSAAGDPGRHGDPDHARPERAEARDHDTRRGRDHGERHGQRDVHDDGRRSPASTRPLPGRRRHRQHRPLPRRHHRLSRACTSGAHPQGWLVRADHTKSRAPTRRRCTSRTSSTRPIPRRRPSR